MTQDERRQRRETTEVLVVDDEDDIRELLELSFLRMGMSCDAAPDLTTARELLASKNYRLCLTDMRLPDGDGLELVELIQRDHPELPVAVISAYGSIETAIRALKLGAFDFVTKPVEFKQLRELVTHAFKTHAEPAAAPNSGRSERSGGGGRDLVGSSTAMQQLRTQILKVARSQAPVYIHGESGTGKEVIARMIHERGPRVQGPFVPVNCGAISAELMESEFFGHRKGSFTGAVTDKEGLFQAARGGTLFLDEVADLPLGMQVKLLRAIQERAVRPVGGHNEEAVDVRILSASHRDIGQLVNDGKFRQDLYFRINVISLLVPPLRDRHGDVPELAEFVLERLSELYGGRSYELSESALAELERYSFPGNVRELENLLERACALCDDELIGADDLQLQTAAGGMLAMPGGASPAPAKQAVAAPARLDPSRWNHAAAAHKLGLSERQLRYRLRRWGVS